MIRHPLSPPGTGDEERSGLPDRWARSGPSLRRPHPRLASGRASGRQVWLPEPAPVNKPRADNRVPENKKPFQGTGPGGPHFQVHDLTSRKPSGAARAPHKAFDGLAWRTQITGPQASQAWPTPHSVDKRPSPKGGTDGWDRRVGPQAQREPRPHRLEHPAGRAAQPPQVLLPGTQQPICSGQTAQARPHRPPQTRGLDPPGPAWVRSERDPGFVP